MQTGYCSNQRDNIRVLVLQTLGKRDWTDRTEVKCLQPSYWEKNVDKNGDLKTAKEDKTLVQRNVILFIRLHLCFSFKD